jgi:hypothetical protein
MVMEQIEERERRVLICHLVQKMRKAGSWAGQTQIQKSIVLLQKLLGVPMGYDFILYKHGPFSFELRSELAIMRVRLQLDLEPHRRYGPSFTLGVWGKKALGLPTKYEDAIEFVAREISVKDTRSLERVSTAFFLQDKHPSLNAGQTASEIHRLKPHISVLQARQAIKEVDELRQKVAVMKP